MKQLKHCVKLQSQVKIYVPSTINVKEKIDSKEWVDKTLELFIELFKGGTCMNALGVWRSSEGELIKEEVTLCYAFCKEDELKEGINKLYNHCLEIKYKLKQECVSLEINGELYFV